MSIRPWREVAAPHPDVASGRYLQAEFMADLAAVISGRAEDEYRDPGEFFARTYFTVGMKQLLAQALGRLAGGSGEPVVQLKTAFGGGKTHSLLALYHLVRCGPQAAGFPGVGELLAELGHTQAPPAPVAVLVGTALSVSRARPDMAGQGVEVRTLWGELAAQLGGAAGYAFVQADDLAGTAPDSTTLAALFAHTAPALILADEFVAYIRNLYEATTTLPAGTFDANLTFVQALTEAVKSTPGVMLVASIPESRVEVGGEGGQAVLAYLEQIFGRVEAVWKAADAGEGFEIVRRRLFAPVQDDSAREATCQAFHRLYVQNPTDFPPEAQSSEYLERLRQAYPVHPEVFDRLYEDWGSLERFQRTRGVLRLLSHVIHRLWTHNDQSPLILPGTVPLDAAEVRVELTKYLPPQWGTVVDSDVDGENSEPLRIDRANPRLGAACAARKVARSIFLGSAPSVPGQTVRGIDEVRIRLGVAQPGDNLPLFSDALGRLQNSLSHLYHGSGRYWYDEHPNLRRTMEERAARVTDDEVLAELERRLKRDRQREQFRGVHICSASADIPDEQNARLVVLGPEATHKRGAALSPALRAAAEILQQRGNQPRQYKNTLLFAAPDESLPQLTPEVRRYLAWSSIVQDHETLNLDAHQHRQAREELPRSDDAVDRRLPEAYCWLLVPTQEGTGPLEWEAIRMPGNESVVTRAARQAVSSGHLITRWSPALLKMELDRWLWREAAHLSTRKLWDYLTTYLYLPRLQDEAVLAAAIREGMRGEDCFGYAGAVASEGGYEGLQFGSGFAAVRLDEACVLVKPEVARAQQQREQAAPGEEAQPPTPIEGGGESGSTAPDQQPVAGPRAPTRFYGTVELDRSRVVGEAEQVATEVIQHLVGLLGAEVTVTLDITARIPDGVPERVIRTVSENCRVLGFSQQEFSPD